MLIFSFPLNKKELAIMSPKKNTHETTFPETVIPEELQSNILVDFNSISFPFPNHNVREKLKGSAITSRNIDNLGIGSVNLYEGKTVSYREVKRRLIYLTFMKLHLLSLQSFLLTSPFFLSGKVLNQTKTLNGIILL